MQAWSTRGLPTAHKLAYWNALSSESIAAMEVTPRDAGAFEGEMLREAVGPLTVIDVRSAAESKGNYGLEAVSGGRVRVARPVDGRHGLTTSLVTRTGLRSKSGLYFLSATWTSSRWP